jgi:hypothetical protein
MGFIALSGFRKAANTSGGSSREVCQGLFGFMLLVFILIPSTKKCHISALSSSAADISWIMCAMNLGR